jgi:hypothetical protein
MKVGLYCPRGFKTGAHSHRPLDTSRHSPEPVRSVTASMPSTKPEPESTRPDNWTRRGGTRGNSGSTSKSATRRSRGSVPVVLVVRIIPVDPQRTYQTMVSVRVAIMMPIRRFRTTAVSAHRLRLAGSGGGNDDRDRDRAPTGTDSARVANTRPLRHRLPPRGPVPMT